MSVRTSAGSLIAITATAPATFNSAGYEAGTYTAIGEITNQGDFGREYEEVTHAPLATRATQKFKGGYNEGTMALQLGLDDDDAGQILLQAALLSDDDYYFRVTQQDGTKRYFPAKTMSFKVSIGARNQITGATCNLAISSSKTGVGVVTVKPTP